MFDIDSKTYKYLKYLSKLNDWVLKTDKNKLEVELLYGYKPKLVENESQETQRYRITESGRRFIIDRRKQTIKSWSVLLAAFAAAIIGLITLLSK